MMTSSTTAAGKVLRRAKSYKFKTPDGFQTELPGFVEENHIRKIVDFEIRPDDVIVATYPKVGSTWVQQIVWLICNDADVEKLKSKRLLSQFGYIEKTAGNSFGEGFEELEKWPQTERRFIKTHLPFQILPNQLQKGGKGKTICVARNPKDCCVSYYHFYRMSSDIPEPGTWSEFLQRFCDGDVAFGSWFDHVHKYWQVYQNRKDDMYFVTYESLKKDLTREVTNLAQFLEKDLSQGQINVIVEECSFSRMSKNKNANYSEVDEAGLLDFNISKFMRKGEVGDWKNHFTVNENKAFDEMFEQRTKDWTLKFEFELQ